MPTTPNPDKVAIIGKAPSSRALAPFDDESCEIWTLSNLVMANEVPRYTRHFELHPLTELSETRSNYWAWMKGVTDKPLYVQELHDELPAAVLYPKSEIVAKFGGYFTNTVSWLIAYAIHLGVKELGVFGVDMAQSGGLNGEYAAQRPSCEYFLGWAMGAGIKVTVPPQADMLKTARLYAFDSDGEATEKWKARTKELRQRMNNKSAERDQASMEVAFLQGALESQDYYQQWLQ